MPWESDWRAALAIGHGAAVTLEPGPRIAATPEPPYVAVIFTSLRTDGDNGYGVMAARMNELAAQQPGYLGIESAREGIGITVSYWRDEESARVWKQVAAHQVAQQRGRDAWYRDYRVRIATVSRDYDLESSNFDRLDARGRRA